ncbi:MAG: hypothetical protein KF855_03375 [Acidobacteria bacterium]|nr:hypothetical protein [Acidobacteriota bacterium]
MRDVKHIKAENIVDEIANRENNIIARHWGNYRTATGKTREFIDILAKQVMELNVKVARLEAQLRNR